MATYRIIGHDQGEPSLDAFDPYRHLNVGDEFTATLDDETEYLLIDAGLIELVVPESAQSGSGVILPWQASHAYAAGEAMTQSGNTWTRNSAGTSRGTFDSTEEAAWTVLPTNATLIENVNAVASGGSAQTLPDPESASQTWITLDAATCALTLPDPVAGASFLLGLKQDATGSRDVTWPGDVVWVDPAGAEPTLSTDPNTYTLVSFIADPAAAFWFGMARGTADPADAVSVGYSGAVLDDDPISYWRLGEPSGTTAADEKGANAGTYTGGVTLGTTGLIDSDADTATTYDGTNDHVVVKTGRIVSALSTWTVEAWAKPSSLATANVIYGESGSAGNDAFRLLIESNGQVTVQLTDTAGTADEIKSGSGTTVPPGVAAHIVAVRDGADYLLYVDGTLVKSGTFTASSTLTEATTESWIGADLRAVPGAGSFGIFFPGVIDEVAVYGSALTPERIAAHYDAAQA